jgi:transcriptional repressor of dcmA and dcmR
VERLFDIRETAEFLNVSEMTIRRWTNSGALKCYRVGGKRERRFRMRDLEEFIQDSQSDRLKPLGVRGHRVSDGSHMAHFYSGREEALGVSVPCVLEGLKNNEVVLVVMPPERSRDLMNDLELQGRSMDGDLQRGRLNFSSGMDSPKEMIRYLVGFTQKTDKFRVVGDMVWALKKGWSLAALRTLEEAGNSLPSREGKLFLCQYSLEDFSGADIMMAAELHGQIIYKGRLGKSPYYGDEKTK